MKYEKNTMGIADRQQLELARMGNAEQAAEQEKTAAKLDYIAMMADIDLSAVEMEDEEAINLE